MPKLVAITGATGFIGREILEKLVEDKWTVRALTRSPRESSQSVQWIQGDLNNQAALQQLVCDTSAVVHCAGVVRGGSLDAFVQTNVEGTKNILHTVVKQTHKPRLILISSLAARQPELSWYAQSKRMAEQCLIDSAENIAWAAFRPTAVYGKGDKELKPLFQATRHGILPVVGKLTNRFGLLHVDDLVAAVKCWLSSEEPVRGVFELDDGMPDGYSFPELALIAQEVWGRKVRCMPIPTALFSLIALLNLKLSHFLNYAPMLTPGKVKEFKHPNWVCDNRPLMQALPAWQPKVRLNDALSQII